ncbi:MAG: dienelactone hydrolase family protein [Pseudomonadota bacterium]
MLDDRPAAPLDNSRPPNTGDWSRRDFVQGAVGVGFAAAVLPVGAQTILTDTRGLVAGPVSIRVGDFDMPAYQARPAGNRPAPIVLVISEIFGLHEHIADVVRRFAHQGFFAIAPDLYARQGDPRKYTDIPALMRELVSQVPDAQVMADLDATRDWAARNGGDAARVGVTGFCWGGRHTWLYAAHAPVQAGVAWYGRLVGEPTANSPRHPIDVVAQLQAPVLGLYGAQDAGIPLEAVDKMQKALAAGSAAARASQFVVYPDAPHAFFADYRPSYRAEAAVDAWSRCLAWLRRHGVASA